MKKKKKAETHRKIAVACALTQTGHVCGGTYVVCFYIETNKSYLFASPAAQTKGAESTEYNLNTQTIHLNICNSFKHTACIDQTQETH